MDSSIIRASSGQGIIDLSEDTSKRTRVSGIVNRHSQATEGTKVEGLQSCPLDKVVDMRTESEVDVLCDAKNIIAPVQ